MGCLCLYPHSSGKVLILKVMVSGGGTLGEGTRSLAWSPLEWDQWDKWPYWEIRSLSLLQVRKSALTGTGQAATLLPDLQPPEL